MPTRKATETGVFVVFLRSLRAWSQAELAREAGVDQRMISRYELGEKIPRELTLGRLAAATGLPAFEAKQALSFIRRALAALEGGPAEAELDAASLAGIVAASVQTATVNLFRPLEPDADQSPDDARRLALELWRAQKDRPARDWRVLIEGASEYQSWALSERLAEESGKAAAGNVVSALELATLAVRAAELAPGKEPQRQRIQGYAWFFLANARRVSGDLPAAEEACSQALRLWVTSSADPGPLQEWRVLDLEASLRREQRRWDEALRLHDRAKAMAPAEEQSRILLKKAVTLEQSGNHELAIETLSQAAYQEGTRQESRLAFALHANLALNLSRLGRFVEADSILPEARRLASQFGKALDLVRLRWVQGLTSAGLGRTDEAIGELSQVREEFLSRGIAFDAALASLDLAILYLEDGRLPEVKTLAHQTVSLFKAQGVDREALAAIKLFREAAEKEEATVEMARRLIECLRGRGERGI